MNKLILSAAAVVLAAAQVRAMGTPVRVIFPPGRNIRAALMAAPPASRAALGEYLTAAQGLQDPGDLTPEFYRRFLAFHEAYAGTDGSVPGADKPNLVFQRQLDAFITSINAGDQQARAKARAGIALLLGHLPCLLQGLSDIDQAVSGKTVPQTNEFASLSNDDAMNTRLSNVAIARHQLRRARNPAYSRTATRVKFCLNIPGLILSLAHGPYQPRSPEQNILLSFAMSYSPRLLPPGGLLRRAFGDRAFTYDVTNVLFASDDYSIDPENVYLKILLGIPAGSAHRHSPEIRVYRNTGHIAIYPGGYTMGNLDLSYWWEGVVSTIQNLRKPNNRRGTWTQWRLL